jgi:hypothetical protein
MKTESSIHLGFVMRERVIALHQIVRLAISRTPIPTWRYSLNLSVSSVCSCSIETNRSKQRKRRFSEFLPGSHRHRIRRNKNGRVGHSPNAAI